MTKDERVIKEIIARYGETLDLRKRPYIVVEIIRQYASRLGGGLQMDCAPPGGPPKVLDPSEIIKELRLKVADVTKLSAALQRAMAKRPKR